MAQRSKRLSKRSSNVIKKEATKPEIQVTEQPVIDSKDAVLKELLYTLLPLCTTECEIHKNFAKIKFVNGNSYSGWLGPLGFQGFGKYEFAGGASYRGSFDKSIAKHLGRFLYENGNFYEGEFLGGQRHNFGFYKTTGFQYNGNFRNGTFQGEGVWKSKKCEKKGYFEDGILVKGEVHECSGVFKGIFDEFALRKHGKYTFKNGNIYEGHWKSDLYFGYGIYSWIGETTPYTLAETKYTGYWMKGEQHALGMLTVSGRLFISQWLQGKKNGAGVVFSTNGNCYAGVGLFDERGYRQAFKIRNCPESKAILTDIVKLITPLEYDMDEKSDALVELVQKLVASYGDLPFLVNPIRIPSYELGNVVPDFCNSEFEAVCLQKVLSENYNEFRQLYLDYKHPGDDYMNPLSLNLLYMDVFQTVRDVNIVECMNNSTKTISNLTLRSEDITALTTMSPIPFYNFFQHIVCITRVLMQNEELKLTVEQLRPTYFGTLAMQVIVVLKMLRSRPKPKFIVREALLIGRSAVVSLIQSIERNSLGDKRINAAYRFLKLIGALDWRNLNFIKAVETYYDNVFRDGHLWETEFEMSNLELVEIVFCTCRLNLEERQRALNKYRKRQALNAAAFK